MASLVTKALLSVLAIFVMLTKSESGVPTIANVYQVVMRGDTLSSSSIKFICAVAVLLRFLLRPPNRSGRRRLNHGLSGAADGTRDLRLMHFAEPQDILLHRTCRPGTVWASLGARERPFTAHNRINRETKVPYSGTHGTVPHNLAYLCTVYRVGAAK